MKDFSYLFFDIDSPNFDIHSPRVADYDKQGMTELCKLYRTLINTAKIGYLNEVEIQAYPTKFLPFPKTASVDAQIQWLKNLEKQIEGNIRRLAEKIGYTSVIERVLDIHPSLEPFSKENIASQYNMPSTIPTVPNPPKQCQQLANGSLGKTASIA